MKKLPFLIFLSITLLSSCSLQSSNVLIDIEAELNNRMGIPVVIPKSSDYHVTLVTLHTTTVNPKDNLYVAHVQYSKKKGGLVVDPKSNNEGILYGQYEGELIVDIQIKNQDTNLTSKDTVEFGENIIPYLLLKDGEVLYVGFDLQDGGSYSLFFQLSDRFSKEEAFKFLEILLQDKRLVIE
jgi:hypothetical protein